MKVVLSTDNKVHSWLIRTFTWSKWSHGGIVINDKVYEATAKNGVVETPLDEYKKRYTVNKFVDIPHQGDYQQRAISQLGKDYDWGAIFKFVLRGDWSELSKWFCFEYIAYCSGILNPKYLDRVTATHLLMISNHKV